MVAVVGGWWFVVVVVVRKGVKIRMDREAVGGEPWCLP
jgi:hypothetical protein